MSSLKNLVANFFPESVPKTKAINYFYIIMIFYKSH